MAPGLCHHVPVSGTMSLPQPPSRCLAGAHHKHLCDIVSWHSEASPPCTPLAAVTRREPGAAGAERGAGKGAGALWVLINC